MILARRSFLTGLGSLLAAPAIVHAGNLMPVRAWREVVDVPAIAGYAQAWGSDMIYWIMNTGDLVEFGEGSYHHATRTITRRVPSPPVNPAGVIRNSHS